MKLRTIQTIATVALTASWVTMWAVVAYWPELLLAYLFY